MSSITLYDDSLMPFGKHKGKPMTDVPADYLIWLFDNGKCSKPVEEYILENIDVLNQ